MEIEQIIREAKRERRMLRMAGRGGRRSMSGPRGAQGLRGLAAALVGALCQQPEREPHGAHHDDFMTIDSFGTRLQALLSTFSKFAKGWCNYVNRIGFYYERCIHSQDTSR